MGAFDFLPTLAEVEAMRKGKPIAKGTTRLQDKEQKRKLTTVTEKDFRKDVWSRDKGRCRCCGKRVEKILDRVPERGEVHHIHGRTGDLRFESKAAILVCLSCHERVTGKVNDKLVIVPTKTFPLGPGRYTDARRLVLFRKAV